jgi:cell division inhibitor SepF
VGMWERVKSRLGLSSDDEYYDDEEYYDEDMTDAEAESRSRLYHTPHSDNATVRRLSREPDLDRAREATLRAVPSVDQPPAAPAQVNMHICKPKSYGEAQTIGDRFKAGTPVIMDLSGTDADLAKRLIDFASGLTYGLGGGLQKVSERVFLLTPPNVNVSAEDRRRLKDTGLFTYDL